MAIKRATNIALLTVPTNRLWRHTNWPVTGPISLGLSICTASSIQTVGKRYELKFVCQLYGLAFCRWFRSLNNGGPSLLCTAQRRESP